MMSLLDYYNAKETRKIELNFPIETTDDCEIILEEKIKEHLAKAPNLKVITILDDLDRLSIDKIVEALDALKAFVGFDRCIFIVPFDDEIIKLALDKRRASMFNDKDDIVESELILDKLFQFKIFLPPLLAFDIKKYAFDLVEREIPDFLIDLCDSKTMQKLLERVIIHPDVATPRQVKKLINAFINNYMLAYEREESGKVQKGLLTSEDGQIQIAKFSVLQADFNQFYDLLFKDMNSIEKVIELHRKPSEYKGIPEHLVNYFESEEKDRPDSLARIKPEFEPLINFLIRTEKYKVDSIAPYLYLAQDDISKKTGDEIQRRFVNALTSGNTESARQLLSANLDVAESLVYQLTLDNDEISDIITVSIDVFEDVLDNYKDKLAQNIIERALEITYPNTKFLYKIDSEAIFNIRNHHDNELFANGFLQSYLRVFTNENWLDSQDILEVLKVCIEKYSELNDEQIEILKNISKICLKNEKVATEDLADIVPLNNVNVFMALFGEEWYKIICDYMNKESDFSKEITNNFIASFNNLKNKISIDVLIINMTQHLTPHIAFLPTLNTVLDGKAISKSEEGKETELSIREGMPVRHATKIANDLIEFDFEKNIDKIHYALNGLPYVISESNVETFDAFASKFRSSSLMGDIIAYCGNKGYFEFLPNAIELMGEAVFEDDENDALFKKVQGYYTDEQREAFLSKLEQQSVYANNKDYSREIAIYAMIALNKENKDFLNNVVENTLLRHLYSYYNQDFYFEFVSQVMGRIKSVIDQDIIDLYVKSLTNYFNGYSSACLAAINRITGKMSQATFRTLFAYLLNISPTDFNAALDIIINHDNLRPREAQDLTDYRKFLVSGLKTTSNPDKVIDAISSSFAYITNPQEMVENAIGNENTDKLKLINLISKLFNADKREVTEIAKAIIDIISLDDALDITINAVKMITKHTTSNVMESLTAQIGYNTPIDTLLCLMKMSEQYSTNQTAISLLLKALELSFTHINQTDKILEALRIVNDCRTEMATRKGDLASNLYSGFHETTSDTIKESIIQLVGLLKIRIQFKKFLNEEELRYYKKWTK